MKCTIIGVAGGTGSGKSTFTNRLKQRFGDHISVIYHDSYYRCHDNIPFEERVTLNYDHPDSLETDLLIQHVEMLKNGIAVQAPVYDFTVHNRKKETVEIKPSPIIVIEGILALQDPRLRDLMDIKIFVEADADERILRRVVRDVEERGRDIRGIISQYLNTVKPMHYIYVEPTKYMADIVINSGLNDVAFDVLSAKIDQLIEQNETESAS
jgi:uridine kinase